MTTPNVDSGVLERNKPLVYPSNVVYRREQGLTRGSTMFTPVFDLGADSWPLDDAERAALNVDVVRVPSPYMRILVTPALGVSATNPGGILFAYQIGDAGLPIFQMPYYIQPRASTGGLSVNVFRFEMIGRRCMFAIQNLPLGKVLAAVQVYRVEVLTEG